MSLIKVLIPVDVFLRNGIRIFKRNSPFFLKSHNLDGCNGFKHYILRQFKLFNYEE
jgi:hypothetical protein